MKIYTIYDKRAEKYHHPFYQGNDDTCKRSMSDVANNPKHEISAHAEDFTLICLGTFNDDTGDITLKKETICSFADLKKGAKNAI